MSESLAIKGVREGLVITLPPTAGGNEQELLLEAIDARESFFRGARLALEVQDRALTAAQLGRIRDALAKRDITLFAVLSSSDQTQEAAANLGLDTDLDEAALDDAGEDAFDTELPGQEAVLVEKTLHSGNHIRHPGHVVVFGDVNAGAEIIAGGNVIVWGRLRGLVHAGAGGDEEAFVCALEMSPTQLRIAGEIALSPEREGPAQPEIARLRGGQIVAEIWNSR